MSSNETMLEQGQIIGQGGEQLAIYLSTISTLMNSRLYESPTSIRGQQDFEDEAEQQEEEQFIYNLLQQVTTLQGKLISDRNETAHVGEQEREREIEEIIQLEQEAELLEQEKGNLDRLVQSEEEKNIELTEQLANRQLSNFQLSRKMENLENELLEINELKQQSDKLGQHNKAMKERKLDLMRQYSVLQLKYQDQTSLLKTLNKQHNAVEAQTLMFQKRFCKLRNEQDKVISVNQAYQHSLCILQTQIRQQTEINEHLIKKQQQLQIQLAQFLAKQSDESKGNQEYASKEEIKQRKYQLKQGLTLLQEIGDQFNDTFFSPLGSLRQLSTKALSTINTQAINAINNKPISTRRLGMVINTQFSSAKKTNMLQVSAEKLTRIFEEPQPPKIQIRNIIQEQEKVVQVSDFNVDNAASFQGEESKFFISKKNEKYANQQKKNNNKEKKNFELKTKTLSIMSAVEIQDICKNLISRLTFFAFGPLASSQLRLLR